MKIVGAVRATTDGRRDEQATVRETFPREIGSPPHDPACWAATFPGVVEAPIAELLLPLRVLQKEQSHMHYAFSGECFPPEKVATCVQVLTAGVLSRMGGFSEWLCSNRVGRAAIPLGRSSCLGWLDSHPSFTKLCKEEIPAKGCRRARRSCGLVPAGTKRKKKRLKAKEQAALTEVARQPQGVPGGAGSGKFVLREGVGSGGPSPAAPRVVQGAGLSTASRPASGTSLRFSAKRHPVVTEFQAILSHRVPTSGTHPDLLPGAEQFWFLGVCRWCPLKLELPGYFSPEREGCASSKRYSRQFW